MQLNGAIGKWLVPHRRLAERFCDADAFFAVIYPVLIGVAAILPKPEVLAMP